MALCSRYCAAASVARPPTSDCIGTRHHAVGVITRKSNAQVRSSSGRPSPSMSLYGWLCSHLGILALISRQSASACCAPPIVRGGQAGRRRRVHHLPEPQRPRVRVDRHQRVHQRCARTRFAGDEHRRRDHLVGDRVAVAVFDELQPRGQQPPADLRRRGDARGVHAEAVEVVDGDREALRQRRVAVVGQAGFRGRGGQQRVGVERVTAGLRTAAAIRPRPQGHSPPMSRRSRGRPSRRSRESWARVGPRRRTS